MNLSAYANQHGSRDQRAGRRWQRGELPAHQVPSGTVSGAAPFTLQTRRPHTGVVCARVSSAEQRTHLDCQADRVTARCAAKGGQVAQVAHMITDCGSGLNDQRPQVLALLADSGSRHRVVEHQDRCSCFGVASVQTLLKTQGRDLVIDTDMDAEHADLRQDVVAMLAACCAGLSGRRRASRTQTHVAAALALELALALEVR